MPRLPNFSWLEVRTYAIQVWPPMAPQDWSAGLDPVNSAWHAGRVNDVIALPFPAPYQNSILAATDSGGAWEINPPNPSSPAGDALPLSDDWDSPDVTCLASDYGNPMRIWAGCREGADYSGGLHETVIDGMALDPWTSVPLPAETASVLRIAIAPSSGRMVLACDRGVFWSIIPPRGGAYAWAPATGLPPGTYYGAAIGQDPAGHETVVVGIRDQIADPQAQNSSVGIYAGAWEQGPGGAAVLRMRIPAVNGLDRTRMTDTSISACRDRPEVMYALSRDATSHPAGQVLGVLTSQDGGQTWRACGTELRPAPGAPMTDIISFSGDDESGGRQKTISVSPTDPQTVAFGWQKPLISADGGDQWQALGPFAAAPDSGRHLHDDIHAIHFDPQDSSRLYIASDGGVATTPDLGASFSSVHNINLRNFQFYSTGIWRVFLGRFAASTRIPGLVIGGLQDNANVYTSLPQQTDPRTGQIPPVPWITSGGGDGGFAAFTATGQVLQSDNGGGVLGPVHVLLPAFSGQLPDPPGPIVPLRNPGAQADPAGVISVALEAVQTPTFARANNPNNASQLMQAIGAQGASVFGFFAFADGSDAHWEQLGAIPIDTTKESIAAVASLDGNIVFAGTQGGRLFALTAASGFAAVQLPTPIGNPQAGDAGAQIARIAVSATTVFVTFNRQGQQGRILRYARADDVRAMQFEVLDSVIQGNRDYYGLEWADGNLYAATDKRVFISSDNGDTWQDASQGLPARPHCSDLRYIVTQDGASALYLSTWGRSLWKADFSSASISGTVTDSQGNPIPGATVRVAESDPGIVPGIYTTTTDAAGHYSITLYPGLYTGAYSLDVFGPDIVEKNMSLGRIPLGATVTQNLQLTRKGTLTGRVADAADAPIPGAGVFVGRGIPIPGDTSTFSFWANTDAAGHYSIVIDPPGTYNAVAAAASFEDSNPAGITITLDTMTPQDFTLIAARPGSIIGTVSDSDTQEAIQGATVEAIVYPTSDSRVTTTDAAGNYTLAGVLSGRRQVRASARHYSPSIQTVLVIADNMVTVKFALTALPGRGSNSRGESSPTPST